MKVLIISDVDVESGRGPVTRLAHVLPELTRRADVFLVALGHPDDTCRQAIEASGVRTRTLAFALRGWRVDRLGELVGEIAAVVEEERPDLVVLYREIWDLMHALPPVLRRLGTPFLVMPHSVPFLDAVPRPSRSFAWDLVRRLPGERRAHAWAYLLTHLHQARLMRTLPRVVINETVDFYLARYFPTAPSVAAIPGYAVEPPDPALTGPGGKTYDVAFMAKLTRGKGLFDTLEVMRHLRRSRPGARMVVIGSFEGKRVERQFLAARRRLGLTDAVELAGWLTGQQKQRVLASARTFCYPSRSADTFSLCLLEALAHRLPAVCYDAPFARCVYGDTPAVRRVPFGSARAMAAALDALLNERAWVGKQAAAARFASRYASWSAVGEAEISAYRAFLDGLPSAAGIPPVTSLVRSHRA
ncbi:glycosyltransferase family 4 protein [Streptomyces sp. NBC_01190]|uniref:glycosyltransferase family 4 protein n=1 Tax=Streptomyces sp. NBC_01190 TaxID=2903767 RepID=UPI00386BA0A5|nr:glycosyltransferase [Streptomyces sp. NBC_01190]